MIWLLRCRLLTIILLFSISSCIHKPIANVPLSEETILVGSWNIQVLGRSKISNPELLSKITDVISRYDIIAIQEIKDITGVTIPKLMENLHKKNDKYSYLLSERSGDEQYAFIYRSDKVEVKDKGGVYRGKGFDVFSRPPHYSYFKTRKGNFDFILINIHVSPKNAYEEISELSVVHTDLQRKYSAERDFIILGDLNADCDYFDENDEKLKIKKAPYIWIIENDKRSNMGKRACTYDRIIMTESAEEDFSGRSGVYYFDKVMRLQEKANRYSDHYPVEGDFYINRDSD